MTSSTKSVEGWSLPRVFSPTQVENLVDGFLAALPSSIHTEAMNGASPRIRGTEPSRYCQSSLKRHLLYLLSPALEESNWRNTAQAFGQEHARDGIPVESISKIYADFARCAALYLDTAQLPRMANEEFLSALTGRLFHDLAMQAAACASTQPNGFHAAIGENARTAALYRALMNSAELVVQAQTERELLDELCRLIVQSGLFSQVWIGRPNLAGDLEIQSLFSIINLPRDQFLPNVYTGDEDLSLAVRAWRQARLQYTNNRLADPAYPAIQNLYRAHNLSSAAMVPLFRDGEIWALLAVLSHEPNIFNPELIELIERIGKLVGHGLDSLDLRQILDEERQHQSWLARHDALTDILNRRGVIERLEEAIARARRHKKMLGVAVMDLDGFKTINDLHGRPAGDLLLRTIADRLQSTLRQTDAVGRLGSDEFVLLIEDLDSEDDLAIMLSRVQTAVAGPIYLSNGRVIAVRSSIGVTLFPQDDSAPERLLRHADRALYAWKEGEDEPAQRWMVFHAEADEQKYVRQKTILTLFRSGNLRIYYQPVIDLQTGQVSGVEALARLANGKSPLLLPGDFLPQFSAADLVVLTHQVMSQSIHDLHRLDKAGFRLNVGINFEPTTLADPKAMVDLRNQVETSGLDPSRIILELLERADTLSVASSQQALRNLKSCGARIALDDVGSAYSSLLRVKELPIDMIKLDRSFLIGLEQQPKELRFLMNLVHLAQALGLSVVAEGIESTASGDALAALGVQMAQGYSIARPMALDSLLDWLKQYKPAPWSRPTSVLGAVALELRGLDASGRIIERRPSFLQHLLNGGAEWENQIESSLGTASSGASRLASAHRDWRRTIADLSATSVGAIASFQAARSAYEEAMFQAALDEPASEQTAISTQTN